MATPAIAARPAPQSPSLTKYAFIPIPPSPRPNARGAVRRVERRWRGTDPAGRRPSFPIRQRVAGQASLSRRVERQGRKFRGWRGRRVAEQAKTSLAPGRREDSIPCPGQIGPDNTLNQRYGRKRRRSVPDPFPRAMRRRQVLCVRNNPIGQNLRERHCGRLLIGSRSRHVGHQSFPCRTPHHRANGAGGPSHHRERRRRHGADGEGRRRHRRGREPHFW